MVEYLGRYTHKVAISNHRLLDVNDKTVSFSYKDYRDADKKKSLTISGTEFLRRFAHHVLPSGFVRIRHDGFLASGNKSTELNLAKKDLGQQKWEKQGYFSGLPKHLKSLNPHSISSARLPKVSVQQRR